MHLIVVDAQRFVEMPLSSFIVVVVVVEHCLAEEPKWNEPRSTTQQNAPLYHRKGTTKNV